MVGYEITIEGLDEQIELFSQFEQIAGRELFAAMQKSVITIANQVKPFVPVDRGQLRAAIGSEVQTISSLSLIGRVGPNLVDELYPQVMEFGREAGKRMPPFQPMFEWVERVIRPEKEMAVRITNAIRWSIAKKGIKGREYLKQGWEASRDRVREYFEKALENIANGLSNKRD